jgi:hypothetical protein
LRCSLLVILLDAIEKQLAVDPAGLERVTVLHESRRGAYAG